MFACIKTKKSPVFSLAESFNCKRYSSKNVLECTDDNFAVYYSYIEWISA